MDEQTYMLIRMELELLNALHTYTGDTTMTATILDSLRAFYSFTDEDFIVSYHFYERQLQHETLRFETMANTLDQEHIRLHDFMKEQRQIQDEATQRDSLVTERTSD
jgi:hypothetical protein